MADNTFFQLNLTGPTGEGQIRLKDGTAVFGRQVGVDILLDDQKVSRQHGQFTLAGNKLSVEDLASSNGTILNGKPLQPREPVQLNEGDQIRVGPFMIEMVIMVVAAPPPPPEPEPQPELEPKPAKKPVKGEASATPPTPPSLPPILPKENGRAPQPTLAPGLDRHSHLLLDYLPGIYHTDFMSRYLALFESILMPIQWNIDNFDLLLSPGTASTDFLPWLAGWFDVVFNDNWTEAQRRAFLHEAHQLFARRGTKWALSRLLEIYLGVKPEIDDTGSKLDPFTFAVNIPLRENEVKSELVERLIDLHKPAHTSYKLRFKR